MEKRKTETIKLRKMKRYKDRNKTIKGRRKKSKEKERKAKPLKVEREKQ